MVGSRPRLAVLTEAELAWVQGEGDRPPLQSYPHQQVSESKAQACRS